ncbi:ClpP/crotonase [Mytilinidion resinicola]|uniref:ClpP/crotonase n=1 Tax=Mytilinidion resinicola TaxID=574789 RepID=A0A6A6YXZ0_9PEZI|nr:ClpP/crotonase [Mytilinidion resinicola]KAF2813792.1 ClpP/crotonase [Mytilinidion resinicola]
MTRPPQLTTILVERISDGAALFYYNQPKISNAFTVKQYLEFREALVWARDEPAIKVLVLIGKLLDVYTSFDLVYAHPAAFFQTPFMPIGFVPEGGPSHTFPKVRGQQHANALLLAGDRLLAQDMYVSGLVTAVVPAESTEEFLGKVCEKARRIAGFGGESLGMAKALVREAEGVESRRRRRGGRGGIWWLG